MKLDVLAFGVHPDDVELGCSGTIFSLIKDGKKVGIVDLTQGELGTRGTADTRKIEASDAAKMMGVLIRENLKMADGFFVNDEASKRKIITAIRKFKPEIIFCNAPEDRHPDHGRSAKLVSDAAFLAGLRKIETVDDAGTIQEAWRPTYVFHYIQDRFIQPSFVIDISEFMQHKIDTILCYKTQFYTQDFNSDEPSTYISSPQFLETVKSRAMMMGKRIGVNYAEGFISEKVIGFKNFEGFIKNVT